jgi:hypothetical protein
MIQDLEQPVFYILSQELRILHDSIQANDNNSANTVMNKNSKGV